MELRLKKSKLWKKLDSSVADPSHFDVDPDPDPGIHIWEQWIRIRNAACKYNWLIKRAYNKI